MMLNNQQFVSVIILYHYESFQINFFEIQHLKPFFLIAKAAAVIVLKYARQYFC
jgi:hypothetical protein